MGKNSPVNLSSFEPMLSYAASCRYKMNFQDPVQKYAECHSWDMSNSNATKYHEIKVGILDNTCFKENVPTFEILVGWILRLGLNFWVINVALYGLPNCVFQWGHKFSFFPSIANFLVEFGCVYARWHICKYMWGWFYDIWSFHCGSVASEAPRIRTQ